ncbi:hypothetical protein ACROYT_G041935 [Oculina patagonica]
MTPYERHVFRQLAPNKGETANKFMVRLRKQARHCSFGEALEENLRDQLIEKLPDVELKKKLLGVINITLEVAMDKVRKSEASREQASQMVTPSQEQQEPGASVGAGTNAVEERSGRGSKEEQTCNLAASPEPVTCVSVGGVNRDVLVDSGSGNNLISMDTVKESKHQGLNIQLQPCTRKLYAYGGRALEIEGYSTATDLGILRVDPAGTLSTGNCNTVNSTFVGHLEAKYPSVFHGIGKLKGYQLKLHVDPSVTPVVQEMRDTVLLEKKKENKLSSCYEKESYEVMSRCGDQRAFNMPDQKEQGASLQDAEPPTEPKTTEISPMQENPVPMTESPPDRPVAVPTAEQPVRRSGRITSHPKALNDYVLH